MLPPGNYPAKGGDHDDRDHGDAACPASCRRPPRAALVTLRSGLPTRRRHTRPAGIATAGSYRRCRAGACTRRVPLAQRAWHSPILTLIDCCHSHSGRSTSCWSLPDEHSAAAPSYRAAVRRHERRAAIVPCPTPAPHSSTPACRVTRPALPPAATLRNRARTGQKPLIEKGGPAMDRFPYGSYTS